MSSLTFAEKRLLENFLWMKSGKVLDLTNNSFRELIHDVLKKDVYSEMYSINGDSKGKRLSAVWQIESDENVAKILSELLKLATMNDISQTSPEYISVEQIIARLSKGSLKLTEPLNGTNFWEPNKIRLFISHRDNIKQHAKALAQSLDPYGISSFVAHDTIEPMTSWKTEILRGLQSMDAFLCFITKDFYESEWTNQEIGFALARDVPIFLYSFDKTDPRGFKLDTQAIKHGEPALIDCMKKTFGDNSFFKASYINSFTVAKNGSFVNAKSRFISLLGLKLTDDEIEAIVQAINGPARSINQLRCLLTDRITIGESTQAKVPVGTQYRDLVDRHILQQHSKKRYSVVGNESDGYRIIDATAPLSE